MKILMMLLTFLIQPVLWIGLIRDYLDYRSRVRRTRRQFGTAVYEKDYELRHFGFNLVFFGIIVSLISGIAEVTLPFEWVLVYELMAGISLIVIPWATFSVTLVTLVALGVMTLSQTGVISSSGNIGPQSYLVVLGLLLLALGLFLIFDGGRYNVPRIFHNQRGTRVAGYPFKELAVIPFLVMIPADSIHQWLGFYPTFQIDGHSMALFLLPLLLGCRLTIFKRLPRLIFTKWGCQLIVLGILGIGLSIVSYRVPELVPFGLILILLLSWLMILLWRRAALRHGDWCSEVINGVRVAGIEPHTPAAKMDLSIGDVILDVNHHAVHNEDDFYKALQRHPTYCRLRILSWQHQFKITSTAIFSDSPHEIGVVPFRNGHLG